uniref:Disease resistance N-terminal domain-containing protein n=1 Tax=Vitis vinifera TaxID=29760 RepID=A5BIB4_VITVI|nr:hypothetical protein VITISV_003863 [Vitis vinifera]
MVLLSSYSTPICIVGKFKANLENRLVQSSSSTSLEFASLRKDISVGESRSEREEIHMAESVVSFAIERIGDYLMHKAIFLKDVREQVVQLRNELRRIQRFLREADARQEDD